MTRVSLLAVAVLGGVLALPVAAAAPIRVQLVTGGHNHDISFYHVFDSWTDLTIDVNPHPGAYTTDFRNSSDVLVLYDLTDVQEPARRRNLQNFLESGKGVVILHHALADNASWPWWYEQVVGARYLQAAEGSRPASTYRHDVDLNIRVVKRHPVTSGLADFTINDEVYNKVWHAPHLNVLLETSHPESDTAVAWICPYQKSRVVYIQLGHGPLAHQNENYRKLVHNAIMWAAGRTAEGGTTSTAHAR